MYSPSFDKSHLPAALRASLIIGGTGCRSGRLGRLVDTYLIQLRGRPDVPAVHVDSLKLGDMQAAAAQLAKAAEKRTRRN